MVRRAPFLRRSADPLDFRDAISEEDASLTNTPDPQPRKHSLRSTESLSPNTIAPSTSTPNPSATANPSHLFQRRLHAVSKLCPSTLRQGNCSCSAGLLVRSRELLFSFCREGWAHLLLSREKRSFCSLRRRTRSRRSTNSIALKWEDLRSSFRSVLYSCLCEVFG